MLSCMKARKELQAATDEVANLPPKQSKATKELQEGLKKKIALLRSHVEKHDQQDERRRENRLHLAETALRQHAACARSGRAHDHTSLFAIVGLWLEYGGGLTAAKDELLSIPTYKLLPLISQLACRLGPLPAKAEDEDEHTFQTALRQVLLRVARAHIHVVLPHLIALANGDRFAPGEETPPSIDRGQLEAAKELIKELRRTEKQWSQTVASAANGEEQKEKGGECCSAYGAVIRYLLTAGLGRQE